MDTVSISVVIPTHNRPDLLMRAIQSVLDQTLLPDEIIVVDDLNDEYTKELCSNFNSDLIRYIPNLDAKGASSSRNLGSYKSRGEFIAFLDDDDEFLPAKLEKQVELIKKESLDICFSQMIVKYENTNISYPTRSKNVADPKTAILMENYLGGTIMAVIRRDLFLYEKGFDLTFKAREEYDLWIRLITNGAKIGVIEEPLTIAYRSLEKRSRISANIDNYISAIDLLNENYKNIVNENLTLKQQVIRRKMQYEFLAAQAVTIGLRKESVQYYLKSFFVKPSLKSALGMIISAISPRLLIKIREKIS